MSATASGSTTGYGRRAIGMRRNLAALHDTTFDLLIIGGGISGACLAHDAVLRGLSVALVERGDFGAATSAASSKLLHSGIRYLQQARVDKVLESARERAAFQTIAPHLSRWVPFLIPTHDTLLGGRLLLRCGMQLHGLLSRSADRSITNPTKRVPSGRYYGHAELTRQVPEIAQRTDVTGAHTLYESHLHSSERMTLAFLKTAARDGAVVANYAAVEGLVRLGGQVRGVTVSDLAGNRRFDVRARTVANAAGPWLTGLNDSLESGRTRRPVTGFSKGAHLITRQLASGFALALSTGRQSSAFVHRGGRHIFVIPWRGHSLIGTTDSPYTGSLDDVAATDEDVADLLADVNAALPGAGLTPDDVLHAFAGLYPLTSRHLRPDVYQGSGDFQIIDHGRSGGTDGVVSVLGAKYTTARRLAQRAMAIICEKLGRPATPCRTTRTPLVGGDIDDLDRFTAQAVARHTGLLDRDTVEHLVHHYGTELDAVITVGDRRALSRLSPSRESIEAEVIFAVEHEMALELADVVFRRTGLGTLGHPGDACVRRCADIMGKALAWSPADVDDQIQRTHAMFRLSSHQPHRE